MKNLQALILIVGTLVYSSCNKEEAAPAIVNPSNLQVNVETSDEGDGLVTVTASANNTNYYRFDFIEGDTVNTVESNNGEASYYFNNTGTHLINSRAYASFESYVSQSDSVYIEVDGPPQNSIIPDTGYYTPRSYPGYNLVWSDEFNGTSLGSHWTPEIGTGNSGWGNNELQYYRAENTEVRDGYLVITAKKENFGGQAYTSSRLITENAQSFQYGRIDIRAALPFGKGIWPALWMLGDNFRSVGWPRCGEIDICEMIGGPTSSNGGDGRVFGTVHWDNNGTRAEFGGSNRLNQGKFADEFHVFSIIWDSDKITWYRDDIQFHEIDITPSELSEFHQKFFLIFNIAVGGNWPGSPNANTLFPQTMAVDYVRVFQK